MTVVQVVIEIAKLAVMMAGKLMFFYFLLVATTG
jgi:hypothetical protein